MNVDSLTPQQLRNLADKKENESKIVKTGTLKCDLYNFKEVDSYGLNFSRPWGKFWLNTSEQVDKLKEEFNSCFELVLPKGTKFVCYVIDGKECWFDDVNYGVEDMDDKWAKKYLIIDEG